MRHHLALFAVVALLAAACDVIPSVPRSDTLLVSVEMSGGLCPDGTCSLRSDLLRDGRIVASDGSARQVDAVTMVRLVAMIDAADWAAVVRRPFTGQCPTAFDGQELVYTFHTGRGPVTIASCTVRIDPGQEPFNTLDRALFGVGG